MLSAVREPETLRDADDAATGWRFFCGDNVAGGEVMLSAEVGCERGAEVRAALVFASGRG